MNNRTVRFCLSILRTRHIGFRRLVTLPLCRSLFKGAPRSFLTSKTLKPQFRKRLPSLLLSISSLVDILIFHLHICFQRFTHWALTWPLLIFTAALPHYWSACSDIKGAFETGHSSTSPSTLQNLILAPRILYELSVVTIHRHFGARNRELIQKEATDTRYRDT